MLKDSGERRQFDTGAVRDIQEGKGRCDLLPLDVCAELVKSLVLDEIDKYMRTNDMTHLISAYLLFIREYGVSLEESMLEVAKHFEDGAKKYGDNNWRKGIPVNCYIDSCVRHYLKWHVGMSDEPHHRAVMWNLLCAMWTIKEGV